MIIRFVKGNGVYILQFFKLIFIGLSIVKGTNKFIVLHLGIWNFCTALTLEWRPNANSITDSDFYEEDFHAEEIGQA